jgi:cell division septum initiation protein DivIVA
MTSPSLIDNIADRVERLLLRNEALHQKHALLQSQLATTTQERDSLKSRLHAARARIDDLLDRLPHGTTPTSGLTLLSVTTKDPE